MGLDMYLYKKSYIGNDYKKKDKQIAIEIDGIKSERISEVSEKVMQWRKANHIHYFFVQNVQSGEDDCKEHEVTREDLENLLDLCKRVNKNHNLAQKLLPVVKGYFFGGTEYGEYYFSDIEETITAFEGILAEKNDSDLFQYFTYNSSW